MFKKLSVVFCVALSVGLFCGMAAGTETVLQTDSRMIAPAMFPNPEDTIVYDSPPPIYAIPDPGPYWAVRFTPTGLCTVKAGLVSVQILSGSPICSLFVWDDVGGVPGPLVGGTPVPFSPTGYPTFDRIDLTSTYVDTDDFWIGIFTLFGDAAPLTDSVTDYARDYFSPDRTTWFSFPSIDPPIPGDLLIRAIVEYPQPANPDVAVDSIIAPPDTVPCLTPAPVSARVCNVGDTTATFDVEALIPGLYGDTITSLTLTPGICSTLTFANWVAPDSHGFCFDVQFRTLLAFDTDPTNDTMSTTSCAWCPASPDVAVDSIVAPPDTVPCLTPAPVSARVCNVGDTTATFDVEALIPGLYGDTITSLTLTPGICSTLTFANWVAPDSHGFCFDVQFRTLLAIDTDPTNDTMSTRSCAWCPPSFRDVGVISVNDPPDTVYADSTVPVAVAIANFGDSTETSFAVSITIGSYSDVDLVTSLAPDETLQIVFDSMTVPSTCDTTYIATAINLLGLDQNPANDTLTKDIYAECPEGVSQEFLSHVPRSFALLQSRPNPFSTSTEIHYQLPVEAYVSLNVYDTAGRLVRNLVGGVEEAGSRYALWDGGDGQGKTVNSGVYFFKLQVHTGSKRDGFTQTRKLILLR